MRIEFDPKTDAIYVRLNENKIVESEAIRPNIVLDFDENGNVTSIEILSISKHNLSPLKKAA